MKTIDPPTVVISIRCRRARRFQLSWRENGRPCFQTVSHKNRLGCRGKKINSGVGRGEEKELSKNMLVRKNITGRA